MEKSLVLPDPSTKAFVDSETMKLSVLLTRGWIRYLLKELDCRMGQLDGLFPTVGQVTAEMGTRESSKRWYRWARGDCCPLTAVTLTESMQVLVTDHAEKLAPGSRRILCCPLRQLANPSRELGHDTITQILLALPSNQVRSFFIFPSAIDPKGESRLDPESDQIAALSRNPSIEALAGAVGIYLEMQRGMRTWSCIAANQYLDILIQEVIGKTLWLGEDAKFLNGCVRQILMSNSICESKSTFWR